MWVINRYHFFRTQILASCRDKILSRDQCCVQTRTEFIWPWGNKRIFTHECWLPHSKKYPTLKYPKTWLWTREKGKTKNCAYNLKDLTISGRAGEWVRSPQTPWGKSTHKGGGSECVVRNKEQKRGLDLWVGPQRREDSLLPSIPVFREEMVPQLHWQIRRDLIIYTALIICHKCILGKWMC